MGKSTPAAPAAPDPVATANAQASANKDAAITQAGLNRIDQVTPQGSIKYSQTGTDANGVPQYTQTQTYSPEQQALYEQQNKIAQSLGGLAQNNVQRVADTQSKDFSFSGMTPQVTGINGGPIQTSVPGAGQFSATSQKAADSAYKSAAARLDPQYAQMDSDLRSRLANSGISEGSDAYNREIDNLGRQRTDAYGMAQSNAFRQGLAAQDQEYQQGLSAAGFANNAQNQGFNQAGANATLANSGRQQQIQEASYERNLPLNDIAALLGTGGGVQNPTFSNVAQVGVAAPDYQGAVYANYNAANQQYQSAMQARSQGLGSIMGLAGSIGSAAIMSDRRLKHGIKRIGTLANGLATYVFSYIGSNAKQFGVMAQDVLSVQPDAVIVSRDGYLAVNYSKVWDA